MPSNSNAVWRPDSPIVAPLIAIFSLVLGQASIFSVLPPLGRLIGFSDFQSGLIVTVSAAVAFLSSPWFGKRASSWGVRRLMLTGLTGSIVAFFGMTVLGEIGLRQLLPTNQLFLLMLLVRGGLFGVFLAAVMVATYSSVFALTTSEQERLAGLTAVQATYGAAMVLGPLIGGLLVQISFFTSLVVPPVLTTFGLALVLAMKADWKSSPVAQADEKLSVLDPRIRWLIVVAFASLLPLAISLITLGFVVQDRLIPSPSEAATYVGLAVFTLYATVSVSPFVVVRRVDWSAKKLTWVGSWVTIVALVCVAWSQSAALLFSAIALLGIGSGLAKTGALAAPSLAIEPSEQNALAGLLTACNTLAFAIGPALGSALYSIDGALPFVATACFLLLVLPLLSIIPPPRPTAGATNDT
jgi:MFS family permease